MGALGCGRWAVVVAAMCGAAGTRAAAPGIYLLEASRIGYAPYRRESVSAGANGMPLHIVLQPLSVVLAPVVLTASRIEQSSLAAPAATAVLGRAAVRDAV